MKSIIQPVQSILLPQPPDLGAPDKFTQWRKYQDQSVLDILSSNKRFILAALPCGCHAPGTGILMYDGSVKIVDDIRKGDLLMGPDSGPREVLSLHNGTDEMVTINPHRGGAPFTVNLDHVLALDRQQLASPERAARQPYRRSQVGRRKVNVTLRYYMQQSKWYRLIHRLYRTSVEFPTPTAPLTLEPYFLGVYIGDGSGIRSFSITKTDAPIVMEVYRQAEIWGLKVRIAEKACSALSTSYFLSAVRRGAGNPLLAEITRMGLNVKGDLKFIPQHYLLASREDRLQLLAGLLDTDGHMESKGFEWSSASHRLAHDFTFLARSLGFMTRLSDKWIKGKRYARVQVNGHTDTIPTRIARKIAGPRLQNKDPQLSGFTCRVIGRGEYFGFELDGDHLYLTADFTVHHNSGKSLAGLLQQKLSGGRLAYLTSSKALQQQLMDDFESCGLHQVKGQNAYLCRLAAEENYTDSGYPVKVESGVCHVGYKCRYMDGGCGYFDAVRAAREEELIATNYAFWMTQYAYGEGLGKFDTLICDEGHFSSRAIESFLAVQFDHLDGTKIGRKLLKTDAKFEQWKKWGTSGRADIEERLEDIQSRIKQMQSPEGEVDRKKLRGFLRDVKEFKDLLKRLTALATAQGEWVVDSRDAYTRFDPLEPSKYAEKYLFIGIKRIIIMSATLTPKDAERLGIKKEEMDYFEYPSTFPVKNRPIYRIPTIRVNGRTSDEEMRVWDRRVDEIVESRLDRKGIVHTTSYERAKRLMRNSRFAEFMFFHTSETTRSVVQKFKDAEPPAILVSPSVSTGFDFPMDDCRYQILGKVPFPNTDSAVIKAWRKIDPDYESHVAMQVLTQSYGRGNRSEKDFCETFLIDDNFSWFIAIYGCGCGRPLTCRQKYAGKPRKHFAPKYFVDALTWCDKIPEAPLLRD